MKLKYIAALVGALIISAESQAWTWSDLPVSQLPVINYGNRVYNTSSTVWTRQGSTTGVSDVWSMLAVGTAFDVIFGRNVVGTTAGKAMDSVTQRFGVRGYWDSFKQNVSYYDRQLLQLPYYIGAAWQYVGRPLAKAAVVYSAFDIGKSWVATPVQGFINGFFKDDKGQAAANNILTILTMPYRAFAN